MADISSVKDKLLSYLRVNLHLLITRKIRFDLPLRRPDYPRVSLPPGPGRMVVSVVRSLSTLLPVLASGRCREGLSSFRGPVLSNEESTPNPSGPIRSFPRILKELSGGERNNCKTLKVSGLTSAQHLQEEGIR